MSLRKLGWFTALAAMLAFLVVGRAGVPGRRTGSPASHRALHAANAGVAPALLVPVQSKDTNILGAGKLLVASRDLGDPNFAKTVVLLVHYDDENVVGLVLNRRTQVPLSRVLEQLAAAKDRTDPAYLGGPVDPSSVFALLRSPAKVEGAEHVSGGLYLIDSKALFEQIIATRPEAGVFHVYLGYGGWTNTQLRMEVELGAWYIFPADTKTVFDPDPDTLWSRMIQKTELRLARLGDVREDDTVVVGGERDPGRAEAHQVVGRVQ